MQIRIAGIVQDSIVDGPGMRLTVFTQGCPHHCEGCHNPETHDFNGGRTVDTAEIIAMMNGNPLLDGITLSGGEPFEQPEPVKIIAHEAHKHRLNVWAYTGWTWEEIMASPRLRGVLAYIDVLVDGRFVTEQRSLALKWRGSANQRVIDVTESLFAGHVVLWEEKKQ